MSLPTDFSSSSACGPGTTHMGSHTCWRRETDSESSEEPPPAEQQHTTDNQPKGSGSVKDGGHQFEMQTAALIGLRGLQRGDNFDLSSNINDAGNFDDLVYTAGGRRYFLQLKHTDNVERNKLTKGELVTLLQNCIKSYCAIKTGDTFKDISIDNSEFIIYTNKELTRELLEHERRKREEDMFFMTSDKGEIFSFSPNDENKEFDLYTLLENYLKESKECRNFCDQHIVTEFLNKLIMVTGQKGQRELDEVIIEEIRKDDVANVDDDVYSAELLEFKTMVETWCRATKDKMTATMFRNWLQEAKTASSTEVLRPVFRSYTKKLTRTGIHFSNSEISQLQAKLFNKHAVHLRSDAVTLSNILLLDCLPQSKCIFVKYESLQSSKNMLLHAWLGGHWEWLIVSCNTTVQQSDVSETCRDILRHVTPAHSKKYFIILTHYSVQEMQTFVPIDHKFNFEQLSKKSQAMVLDKKIDFQGCKETMRSVLQRHGNVEHVLGPELVTDLITEKTAVNIGGKLHVNTGYYAPRVLQRKVWLHLNVLRNTNDIFAVSGTAEEEVHKIVPSGESVEFISRLSIIIADFTEYMNSRIFLIPKEDVKDCFHVICRKVEGKPLHLVEFNNGGLLWKMSRGGTDSLLHYVDAEKTRADKRIITECMKSGSCEVNEDSIWDLDERTVLVVAEPGMGKSSTTTQVALHTKQRDPTSWVVRINWNEHTTKLQEINAAPFNLDTLVEFLCSAALSDSKYTDINRSLLKQALQSSGNVTVLMDGFDEISPTYADKAADILPELMKTKVGRVWVTSRPVQKERLEKKLCVIACSMKNLSRTSQEEILRTIWTPKAREKKDELLQFVQYISSYLKSLFYKDNFIGCPLYITIIACVYEKDMETSLELRKVLWPKFRYNKLKLYESLFERKLHIHLSEKQKANTINSCGRDDHEVSKQIYLKHFEKCALAVILPPPMLESLHNKKTEEEIEPFLGQVQAGNDKTGIVMNVVEGKPQFVHRTFAEYFTARWFSKNFESNRSVLEHILFDRRYSFMTDMFDRMLAKGCPLHCAVLDRNTEKVKTLLQEGFDVNAVDKGGRTVMHIIATHHSISLDIIKLLFHCGVSLDKKDCVLQWTPLHYAVKTNYWILVELFLERNIDRSGLDMIRQRVHDKDYIEPIIIEAAKKGHVLLLEFIRSTDVNIHQASSMDYPSLLLAAIQRRQLEVVRWLIKHGADCNTTYSDGQIPLFHAVIEGSLDVVCVLVEEGGASLDVCDDYGWTAIDWAKDCISNFTNRYGEFWMFEVVERQDIVKYLQERLSSRDLTNSLRGT